MSFQLEKSPDLWENHFGEMAEKVHRYILESLEEPVEYTEISGDRREVETGYNYTAEGLEFKFSLAGTVNSDPEILRDGKRKIVFQTEDDSEAYQRLLKELEKDLGTELKERNYGDLDIYEIEVKPPYR